MRGAWLIFKKECLELSRDRKTIFFTFVMPLILYPLIFGMISMLGKRDDQHNQGRATKVCVVDPSGFLAPILRGSRDFQVLPTPSGDVGQAIRDRDLDLAVEVETAATAKLQANRPVAIQVVSDQSEGVSRVGLERLRSVLRKLDDSLVRQRLDALRASPDLAVPTMLKVVEARDTGFMVAKQVGAFLPYILMIMMFAGAMQHGIYATAGEKERGTLLCLLSTRLPRRQIVLGKLLYIFSVGVASALVNLLAMAFSLGRVLADATPAGMAVSQGTPGLGDLASIAHPVTLALTLLLMLPLGLFFANVILLGGIQARNTMEAGTALTPAILVVMVLGIFSLGPGIERMGVLPYVPVLNVSLAIRKLFSMQANALEYAVAFLMTAALAALLTWLSTRILEKDTVLFRG